MKLPFGCSALGDPSGSCVSCFGAGGVWSSSSCLPAGVPVLPSLYILVTHPALFWTSMKLPFGCSALGDPSSSCVFCFGAGGVWISSTGLPAGVPVLPSLYILVTHPALFWTSMKLPFGCSALGDPSGSCLSCFGAGGVWSSSSCLPAGVPVLPSLYILVTHPALFWTSMKLPFECSALGDPSGSCVFCFGAGGVGISSTGEDCSTHIRLFCFAPFFSLLPSSGDKLDSLTCCFPFEVKPCMHGTLPSYAFHIIILHNFSGVCVTT